MSMTVAPNDLSQMRLAIINHAMQPREGARLNRREIARKLKNRVPRDTVMSLFSGTPVKVTLQQARFLAEEARKSCEMPYAFEGELLLDDVLAALGVYCKQQDPLLVRRYIYEALECWIPVAFSDDVAPSQRMLRGRLAGLVLLIVRNRGHCARHNVDSKMLDAVDKTGTLETLDRLYSCMRRLLSDPKALFGKDNDELTPAQKNGARYLGFHIRNETMGVCVSRNDDLPPLMKNLVDEGFVDDARWISKISGHSRILPLKNAWFALSVAGYWRRSVELAADFLHPDHHLDHIAIEKDGDRPILKDEDSWPALAAILAYEDVDGLGPARKRLRPDVVAHPRFGIAVEVMKPLILKDAPYSAVLEAMKEVMK